MEKIAKLVESSLAEDAYIGIQVTHLTCLFSGDSQLFCFMFRTLVSRVYCMQLKIWSRPLCPKLVSFSPTISCSSYTILTGLITLYYTLSITLIL